MVRDRSAILIGVVAPFALAALFSSILGGLDQGFHARWGIVDHDRGEISSALRGGPLTAMQEAGLVELEELPSEAAARSAVEEGHVATAIVLPAGLSADVGQGTGAIVDLIIDPGAGISAGVARAALTSFVHDVESVKLAVATTLATSRQLPDEATVAGLTEAALALPAAIRVSEVAAADREVGSSTYYAAAMAILFVFLSAQMGITSLHAEKRQRTLARMLAAPISWRAIVAGKILVSLTLGLLSMGVIVVGTSLLLGATFGDPLSALALITAASLAATGVATLVVSLTRTEEQAGNAMAVTAMLLAIVGGSFFPVDQAPELLASLSLLTPHAWFLRGVGDASAGDIAAVAGALTVLVLIGVACGGIGLLRMRRLVLG